MAPLPRLITVDPTGGVARLVRAALDLSDYACRQIDVPTGADALAEAGLGGSQVMLLAQHCGDMRAADVILQAQALLTPGAVFVVLADEDGGDDEALLPLDVPGVLILGRPLDAAQFVRVLQAALRGEPLDNVLAASGTMPSDLPDLGPVPNIALERARATCTQVLNDTGASATLLLTREGRVLLETGGAALDRARLTHALLPTARTMLDMRAIVGGDAWTLQFFDGDAYDLYVLSVGLHHLLVIVFNGQTGVRQFGAINRFGRRAVQDLIAFIGAAAFLLQRPIIDEPPTRKTLIEEMPAVAASTPAAEPAPEFALPPTPEVPRLEAIPDDAFDPSLLDGPLDEALADDLFNLDRMEQLANEVRPQRRSGTLNWDQMVELGLMNTGDGSGG